MINIYEVSHDSLAHEHYTEIVAQLNKCRSSSVAAVERWLQRSDPRFTLEYVIKAKPDQLREIRSICGTALSPAGFPREIMYFQTMYDYFSEGQGKSIGNSGYNAIQLMDKLKLRVCPLCNRNHIGNVTRPQRGTKRTSQLDHFHNKSDYPYLAMSFYNLIPSCPCCNHAKGKEDIDLSPYDAQDLDPLLQCRFNIENIDFLFTEEMLEVSLRNHPSMQKNIDVLGLEDLYAKHNDVAYEIVQKFKMYTRLRRKEILDTFPGLYRNEEDLRTSLFGSYANKANMKKQVLAKLKKDIFELLEAEERRRGSV
ncbi:hypothetical protein D3P07_01620 [Paenibacillus sp. 1011MAR3C5]|uniref:hypothetical protein n=1 Tax=Paenibacillus sp. 1011MAR3C5 TaxID=1675787 RepID=UPI000E6BA1E5|nr:hypothetical protein [Paenibacillus sp. 1011MAR3C5]RJE90821.1 hypothetical protein D3P07_01620 [Paenibacillus sp. 1011MAR3C5]